MYEHLPFSSLSHQVILERLQILLQMDNGATDKSQLNDLQSLLCATLQSVLRKMTKEDVPLLSDTIMTALLQVLNMNSLLLPVLKEVELQLTKEM